MKSKLVRIISMLIATLLLLSIFGCASKDNSTQLAASTGDAKKEGPSWTWDTSPVELTWFVNENWYTRAAWDVVKNPLDKAITEKTGVKIKFSSSVGSTGDDKLNVMLASGELPDLVTQSRYVPAFNVLQTSGKFAPLMELIDKYAPTFKKDISNSMVSWYTQPDGKWYSYMNYFFPMEKMKNFKLSTNVFSAARKDILDSLGLKPDDFTTQEKAFNAFKKVKDSGIMQKGKALIPWLDWYQYDGYFYFPGIPAEDSSGNLIDIRRHPQYLDCAKWLNKCYNAGLLCNDAFTASGVSQLQEIFASGRVFFISGNVAEVGAAMQTLYKKDHIQYVPVGPIKINDQMPKPWVWSIGSAGWQGVFISNNSTHKDRAIRLLEFMASKEGNMLCNYGIEGVTYTLGSNGRVEWTKEYLDALAKGGEMDKKFGTTGQLTHCTDPILMKNTEPLPVLPEQKAYQAIPDYWSNYTYNEMAFSNTDPPATTKEGAILPKLNQAFNEPKLIIAKPGDVEKLYKEMLDKQDKLGYQQVYDYQNRTFKENKVKLGVEFAYPINIK
jgi:putative aldouronate transport system substrate-binding protein